jgi:hypothetical protein
MAITTIPTRTSSDTNASADINTLMANDIDLDSRVGGKVLDIQLPAGAWDRPSVDYAEFDTDIGTNATMRIEQFDDTTEEFLEAQFIIPSGVSGTDNIYFDIWGYSETPVASKNIGLKVQIKSSIDTDTWDSALSTLQNLAITTNPNAGEIQQITLNDTLNDLSLDAGSLVNMKFSRVISGVSNNLVGDWNFANMRVYIA